MYKSEIKMQKKNQRQRGYLLVKNIQSKQRSIFKLVFALIKDNATASMVRIKGHARIMSHQIFGFIVLLL